MSKLHFSIKFFLKKFSSLRNILRFASRKREITIKNFNLYYGQKKEFIPLVTARQRKGRYEKPFWVGKVLTLQK